MSKRGTLWLVDEDGEKIVSRSYPDRIERARAIAKLKKLYAKAFDKCSIQIIPDTDEKLVDPLTGMNCRKSQKSL